MIKTFVRLARTDADASRKLYRMVAGRIRARLKPEDAEIVAAWFDRLASGEDPREIFPTRKAGRPKKAATGRTDDFDIANIVHQHISAKILKPGQVYAKVAKAHGISARTVANIYSRLKKELHKN